MILSSITWVTENHANQRRNVLVNVAGVIDDED